jgi:hypothetical protein
VFKCSLETFVSNPFSETIKPLSADMDCLSEPESSQYNCSHLWGLNCTSQVGFDFSTAWNYTQRIQRYCSTDNRLFREGNIPATPGNTALTGAACRAFAGSTWQKYPGADIWVRLTTWKFPLLQLIASSPRPPLGFAIESFVVLHLIGDPIGTINDLLRVTSSCQKRAESWREYLKSNLSGEEAKLVWKSFTIVTVSYDEWGEKWGNTAMDVLQDSL